MFFVLRRRRVRKVASAAGRSKYLAYREQAQAQAHERVAFWSGHYQVSPKRIAIRNTRSRWGSCSKRGNLNFSYKIIFLSRELVDYIIVHEICHLREFNHSAQFWSLVAVTIPNHRAFRQQLRNIFRTQSEF